MSSGEEYGQKEKVSQAGFKNGRGFTFTIEKAQGQQTGFRG